MEDDISVVLLQAFRRWDHIVNLLSNSQLTYHVRSSHASDDQCSLKTILVTSNNRKIPMGISLTRKRFGAMVLAVFSWMARVRDITGAILLEINGDVVFLESYQSITSRIKKVGRPIHLRFLVQESVLDLVLWEKDLGIVWGPCSDVAQVSNVLPTHHAYRAGVRVGDVVMSLQKQIISSEPSQRRPPRESSAPSPSRDGGAWRGGGIHTPATTINALSGSPRRTRPGLDRDIEPRATLPAQSSSNQPPPGSVRLIGLTYNKAFQMTHHSQPVRGATVFQFVGERRQEPSDEKCWRETLAGSGTSSVWVSAEPSPSRNASYDSLTVPSISSALSSVGHVANMSVSSGLGRGGSSDGDAALPRFSSVFDGHSVADASSNPINRGTGSGVSAQSGSPSLLLDVYRAWPVVDALGVFLWTCPFPSCVRCNRWSVQVHHGVESPLSFFLPQLRCPPAFSQLNSDSHRTRSSSTRDGDSMQSGQLGGGSVVILSSLGCTTSPVFPSIVDLLQSALLPQTHSSIGSSSRCSVCGPAQSPTRKAAPSCMHCGAQSRSGASSLNEPLTCMSLSASNSDDIDHCSSNDFTVEEDESMASYPEMKLLLDECMKSPAAACRLFWLFQTAISSRIELPPSPLRQERSGGGTNSDETGGPLPAPPPLARQGSVQSSVSSLNTQSSDRSGGRPFSAHRLLSPSSPSSRSSDPAANASGTNSHSNRRRGSNTKLRVEELAAQRRSMESALMLNQFMRALKCHRIAASELRGSAAIDKEGGTGGPHRLIYATTQTFTAGSNIPSDRSSGQQKIVDILHKQSRLLVVVRRCVNLVKSPQLMDGSTGNSGDSLAKLVEEPSASSSTAEAKSGSDAGTTPKSSNGLFSNPTQRRNAVLPKAIRLSIMADARMHNTPLFPVQDPMGSSMSAERDNEADRSSGSAQLLHGIKISECRVLSSANYPILLCFTEHMPRQRPQTSLSRKSFRFMDGDDTHDSAASVLFPTAYRKSDSRQHPHENARREHSEHKRFLLFKHNDDLRQDALVLQIFRMMNEVLVTTGLDLGLQFYDVLPTGPREGFVEWLEGAVPLAVVISKYEAPEERARRQSLGGDDSMETNQGEWQDTRSSKANRQEAAEEKAAVTWLQSVGLGRAHNETESTAVAVLAATSAADEQNGHEFGSPPPSPTTEESRKSPAAYPHSSVKTFFHLHSPDPQSAMDRFVKSCAGNSALTYLLGVGDRHLENILVRPSGAIIHCDFGFCFGRDPGHVLYRSKLRFTKEMLSAMGGEHSEYFYRFQRYLAQAFNTLRRHSTLLFSALRAMFDARIPDLSVNQSAEEAVLFLRSRLLPDMDDAEAGEYIKTLAIDNARALLPVVMDKMHEIASYFR